MFAVGEKIKELRIRDGYSQERLAEKLGISFQAISKWETGISMPDITMIPTLAKLFKVSADELLGLTDEKSRKQDIEAEYAEVESKAETLTGLLEIAKKAMKEFPDEVQYWLWATDNALQLGQSTSGEERIKYLQDTISYADTVISLCGEGDPATEANAAKSLAYILLGEKEKALQCISEI